MGVIFAKPDKNDRIIEVARNSERGLEGDESLEDDVTLAEECRIPTRIPQGQQQWQRQHRPLSQRTPPATLSRTKTTPEVTSE